MHGRTAGDGRTGSAGPSNPSWGLPKIGAGGCLLNCAFGLVPGIEIRDKIIHPSKRRGGRRLWTIDAIWRRCRQCSRRQTAIVQHLAMPGVLGVSAPKRMMTHGAYVFLVGDRAYKLKRDVKYSYMDFSTQAQRDAAALAEIHINRRTAPDLYLGVAPVFNNGGDIRIGDVSDELTASAQEHLVVMRRFDETQTLDVLADAGAVDGALAERLAVQIAHFHNATPGMVVDGAAMKLASISGRTMRDLVAGVDALGEQIIAKLHEAMQATLIQALSEVDERGQAGLVRRLHGDLHLGNVALIEGAPVIFDALEFDDAMATVDVLHDAAFLGMDLWTRGLQDAAARMWSRYLAERRDYSGLALAPVFFSMRAGSSCQNGTASCGID